MRADVAVIIPSIREPEKVQNVILSFPYNKKYTRDIHVMTDDVEPYLGSSFGIYGLHTDEEMNGPIAAFNYVIKKICSD